MLTMLRKITGATAVVPVRREHTSAVGTASLRKHLPCRKCGRTLTLVRFVRLVPSGVRGYYSDSLGHIVAIDRNKGVTLEWKPARGHSSAFIVAMGVDATDGASTLCLCLPPPHATSFAVPPAALANLPTTLIPGSYYYQLALVTVPSALPPSVSAAGVGAVFAVPISVVSKSVAFLP